MSRHGYFDEAVLSSLPVRDRHSFAKASTPTSQLMGLEVQK
jgi:hypothetical protein